MSIGSTLEICGFLDIADVASPPILSRHLVLPTIKEKLKEGKFLESCSLGSVFFLIDDNFVVSLTAVYLEFLLASL